MVFAVWWNPFTWFKKEKVNDSAISQVEVVEPILETEPNIVIEEKIFVEAVQALEPVVKKPVVTPQAPIVIPPVVPAFIPTPVIAPVPELLISNVSIDTKSDGAKISWETNILAESKVLIEGMSFVSKRGVSTDHYVDVIGLESDLLYSGSITALANNSWKSESLNFTTESEPLKITITQQNCPSNKCSIGWKTNYKSDGRIRFYLKGSNDVFKSINSNTDSKDHVVEITLDPNTEYDFKIYATGESKSSEATGQINTGPLPSSQPCQTIPCVKA